MNISIMDTTLRDGAQAPGVSFSREEKQTIARMLSDAGINELEVGTPAIGPSEQEDIRAIAKLNLNCRLTSWCRAKKEDLEDAARCNTGSVQISFPASSILQNVMNKSEAWVFENLEKILVLARRDFDYVSVGAQDATRADRNFLKNFIHAASSFGAYRVRIADTVGIGRPFSIANLMNELSGLFEGISLEFHAHNDLGMATANTLTAIESGADTVSVTVNGLGERAGNAALEQVVMSLAISRYLECSFEPDRLIPLCNFVAKASCRPISEDKPITGSLVFTHESGIHCHGMMKDNRSYEPFSSDLIGRERQVGKKRQTIVSFQKYIKQILEPGMIKAFQ